ncbi:MAG: MFS transporter [Desulfobacteraceae bacterium]|nr:MFS transporter [Desulfobacteraceae bacterium]
MIPEFINLLKGENREFDIIPSPRKKIFLTLFFTIFTTVTGVGIVVPLLPVYANDLGAKGIYIGMIFGAFALSRTFFLPWFGRASDRHGRKPFIVAGLLGYILVSMAFVTCDTVTGLILFRFIQGIASAMIMPVVQAYVGEITPRGREGYAMGLFNMSMFASLSLGPLMGGVIADLLSMDAAFACLGFLSATGLCLSIVLLPPTSDEQIRQKKHTPLSWASIIKDPTLIGLFVYRFSYTACIGIIWSFLPIFVHSRFDLSDSLTGVLVMLGVFISGLLQLPMGYAADRFNTKVIVSAGGVLCAIAMWLIVEATSYAGLVGAITLFGLGGGISMPSIMAMAVVKGHEKGAMGAVISLITMSHSLGMLTGSMAAGIAMDHADLVAVFPLGAVLMLLGGAVFHLTAGRAQT